VKKHFGRFGGLIDIRMRTNKETGKFMGTCVHPIAIITITRCNEPQVTRDYTLPYSAIHVHTRPRSTSIGKHYPFVDVFNRATSTLQPAFERILGFCRHVYSLTHAKRLYIFLSFFCWSGTCFVEYDDREAHGKALGLHHSKLCGRVVNVELTVGVRDQSAFSLELKKTPFRLKTCLVVCVNYDECNSILL
jgi:hypothetical protein